MTVLDTHAWLWWLDDVSNLGSESQRAIETAISNAMLAVSTISVWEAALLVTKDDRILEFAAVMAVW